MRLGAAAKEFATAGTRKNERKWEKRRRSLRSREKIKWRKREKKPRNHAGKVLTDSMRYKYIKESQHAICSDAYDGGYHGWCTLTACESTTGKTMGQNVSDASVSTAVQTKLTGDRVSNFTRVDVDTERGIVQLSGVVPSSEQKSRAEELTRQVNGVRQVNNNLQIQASHDSDRSTVK